MRTRPDPGENQCFNLPVETSRPHKMGVAYETHQTPIYVKGQWSVCKRIGVRGLMFGVLTGERGGIFVRVLSAVITALLGKAMMNK